MRIYNLILLILLLTCFSSTSFAADDYKCLIERFLSADSGEEDASNSYAKLYIGKEFTVERKTGLMAGALKNSYLNKPIVVDYGSNENSYKVINYLKLEQGFGEGTNIYALTIMEFVDAQEKPFLFLTNSDVFLGKCVHF